MDSIDRKKISTDACLIAFSLGIISHRFSDFLLPHWVYLVGVVVCCLIALKWKSGLIGIVLFTGLLWVNLVATNLLTDEFPRGLENQDVTITGHIIGVPAHFNHYSRFEFFVDTLQYQNQNYDFSGRIRLNAYHGPDSFGPDQQWKLTVRLKLPHGRVNPGSNSNYEAWLFANRIRATGYVRDESSNQLIGQNTAGVSFAHFRYSVARFIEESFPQHSTSGILSALIVGVRHSIAKQDWLIFQRTGTTHLIAISGLHIGLVAGVVMMVMSHLWRVTGQLQARIPAKMAAMVVAVFIGFLYAQLAGFSIPTRRALVMLITVGLCILLRRNIPATRILLITVSVVLLFDPISPVSRSFWLSFLAVVLIVSCICHSPISIQSGLLGRVKAYAQNWVSVQTTLFIGLTPVLLLMFNQVSIVSPLANLVAIPLVGMFIVPMGLLGLCTLALGLPQLAIWIFSGFALGHRYAVCLSGVVKQHQLERVEPRPYLFLVPGGSGHGNVINKNQFGITRSHYRCILGDPVFIGSARTSKAWRV